jgi:hypothetical protein
MRRYLDYGIENKPYIEAQAELKVENESVVQAFIRGPDEPNFCLPQADNIEAFCIGANLESLRAAKGKVSELAVAWLDERSFVKERRSRTYRGPLTARDLYKELKKPRLPTARNLYKELKKPVRYLPMIINGSKYRTIPDTGSLENAISADEARRLRLNLTGDTRQFVMGNGSTTMSVGSVSLKCAFAQGDSHTAFQQFNVIENLAVPVIMGKRFLDNSKTLTSNQHRLEVIYKTVKRTFRLLHLDRPRQLMRCYVNGSLVHANADTGAEMDLMSPSFALSNSLNIETLDEWERLVELADGSTAELWGKVRVGFDAYDACSSSPTKANDTSEPSILWRD